MISPVEDYQEEGELLAKIIAEESHIPVETLLDLGCGGGHVDFYLKRHFQITAVDISPPMLQLARTLNPEITYLPGDMRTIRLDRLFDAVLIHDAINCMLTPDDLGAAFQTAYQHLRPGGVFITLVEVWPGSFHQNRTAVTSRKKGDVEIVFIENYYDPDPKDTSYESSFVYLIRQKGRLVVERDHHLCGIFPVETWLRLLKDVGFAVKERKYEHSQFAPGESYPLLVSTKIASESCSENKDTSQRGER